MSFNIEVLPPESRSKAHRQAHLELFYKSQDIIAVRNPTDTDFKITYDAAVTGEAYVVPNINKDIGYGKGVLHVKRYIARLYVDKMGKMIIHTKSKEKWLSEKREYRLEEQGMMEENLAIRTTDPKIWDEILPSLWLGVVEVYRPGIEEVEPVQQRVPKDNKIDDVLDRIGLLDKSTNEEDPELQAMSIDEIESRKKDLINELE